MNKIALYTVNVGGYDTPVEPPKIKEVDKYKVYKN